MRYHAAKVIKPNNRFELDDRPNEGLRAREAAAFVQPVERFHYEVDPCAVPQLGERFDDLSTALALIRHALGQPAHGKLAVAALARVHDGNPILGLQRLGGNATRIDGPRNSP